MRHRVYGKHLGKDYDERNSLFRSLLRSLISHGSLQTSITKSQAIKGLVDKLIVAGKKNTESTRRFVLSSLASEELTKKVIEEIAPRFKNRSSGFTQVVKIGRRLGDGTMIVKMSLIEESNSAKASLDKEEKVTVENVGVEPFDLTQGKRAQLKEKTEEKSEEKTEKESKAKKAK